MKDFLILMSPVFWSIKNDLVSFNRSFYRKILLYSFLSIIFILLVTKLLNTGMIKLQDLSPEVFTFLLTKGYSLIFLILFFVQIINGFIMSFNNYYQSKELGLLFLSPVNRTSLFFSILVETHLKTSWMLIIFGAPLLVSLGSLLNASPLYYVYSLVIFTAFSIIPVNIGITSTIMLSGMLHIKKLKQVMFSAGLITLIALITLLRLFKPERFVNPEFFANLQLFLVELEVPLSILLPNRWLSESLFNFLNKNYSDTWIFVSLLFLTSYITVFFLLVIYKKYHYRGWNLLSDEGTFTKNTTSRSGPLYGFKEKFYGSGKVQRLLAVLDTQSVKLFRKDLLYQLKDTKNLNQMLILFSLVIIYLFSIASLPLNWVAFNIALKYIISFLNLGLILIIMASLCSKLVYPAVVYEGNSLWIIKTSPITSKKYIWLKFIFLSLPVFLVGQVLTIFSSLFLDIDRTFFFLIVLTTTLMCFSLVSMSITFGVSDVKNSVKEGESEEMKTGNVIYMISSFFFIVFTLALEIIPTYLYFLKESGKIEFIQKTWLMLGAMIFIVLLVNISITAVSIHLSIKRFDNLQIN